MADRFTETQMLKLVEIYQDYPCLWNVTSELYKNRNARECAYKEIWEKLNIPGLLVKDIPKKIKNMRSSYYQELKKIEKSRKSGAGEDSVYQPKVSWFATADGFLRMVRNNQETFWNIYENSNTPTDNFERQNNEYLNEENSSAADDVNNPDDNHDTISNDSRQNEDFPEYTVTKVRSLKKTKKKKDEEILIAIEKIDKIARNLINTTNLISHHKEDEFDAFGKYIAMSLRSLPGELGIIAKTDIQKALSNVQIKALRQNSQTEMLLYGASSSYDPLAESPPMQANMDESESIMMPQEEKIILKQPYGNR